MRKRGNDKAMYRRTYRNFELEATPAREGGYVVRILRRGLSCRFSEGMKWGGANTRVPTSLWIGQ